MDGESSSQLLEQSAKVTRLCVAAKMMGSRGEEELDPFDRRLRKVYGERSVVESWRCPSTCSSRNTKRQNV